MLRINYYYKLKPIVRKGLTTTVTNSKMRLETDTLWRGVQCINLSVVKS